jgi:hypothetical protein
MAWIRVSGKCPWRSTSAMGLSPVAGHPAVAVFREPRGGRAAPALGPRVDAEAKRAVRVLAGVATHARPVERTLALWHAASAAGALVAALSDQAPAVAGEALPAESIIQSFLRVREEELSGQQAALHGVLVIHRALEDLCDAPLSGGDLALELAGMRQAVVDLTGAAPGTGRDFDPLAAVLEPGTGACGCPDRGRSIRRRWPPWLQRSKRQSTGCSRASRRAGPAHGTAESHRLRPGGLSDRHAPADIGAGHTEPRTGGRLPMANDHRAPIMHASGLNASTRRHSIGVARLAGRNGSIAGCPNAT